MKNKILIILKSIHNLSGGHGGISIIKLKIRLDSDLADLKNQLNKMHREKLIKVYEGINTKLIKIINKK